MKKFISKVFAKGISRIFYKIRFYNYSICLILSR